MKSLLAVVLALAVVLGGAPAHAVSLQLSPPLYREMLAQGEKKKGFVDIANPTTTTLILAIKTQAFRQTDNQGNLAFYDDPQVSAGIIPDLTEAELGPREKLRLYFLVDGSKLPQGDVFAGLLVRAEQKTKVRGIAQAAQLGTILALTNGTPRARTAEVTHLDIPFLQMGDGLQGSYRIKNTADPASSTGFFPQVDVVIDPLQQRSKSEGSLVFAGRERPNELRVPADRLGLYRVSVGYGDASKSAWVFMVTGYWRSIVLALGVIGVAAGILLISYRRNGRHIHYRAPGATKRSRRASKKPR